MVRAWALNISMGGQRSLMRRPELELKRYSRSGCASHRRRSKSVPYRADNRDTHERERAPKDDRRSDAKP